MMLNKTEKWAKYARYILNFCGACSALTALLGALLLFIAQDDQTLTQGELVYIIFAGLFIGFLGAGFGFLNIVVSRGLSRGERWAWIGGVILGVMYLTSLFFPIGAILLYSLFQAKVLFEPKQATNIKNASEE